MAFKFRTEDEVSKFKFRSEDTVTPESFKFREEDKPFKFREEDEPVKDPKNILLGKPDPIQLKRAQVFGKFREEAGAGVGAQAKDFIAKGAKKLGVLPIKEDLGIIPVIEDLGIQSIEEYGLGNINLLNRPRVKNKDDSISTVRSMSVGIDGQEVLIPTISEDGRIMSDDEAIDVYKKTGKYLGKFKTIEDSLEYAKQLHNDQQELISGPTKDYRSMELPPTEIDGIPLMGNLQPGSAETMPALEAPEASELLKGTQTLAKKAVKGVADNKLVKSIGSTFNALAGSILFPLHPKTTKLWEQAVEDSKEADLDEISDTVNTIALVLGPAAIMKSIPTEMRSLKGMGLMVKQGAQAYPEYAKEEIWNSNLLRKVRIANRELTLVPNNKRVLEIYDALPSEVLKKASFKNNPSVKSALIKREREVLAGTYKAPGDPVGAPAKVIPISPSEPIKTKGKSLADVIETARNPIKPSILEPQNKLSQFAKARFEAGKITNDEYDELMVSAQKSTGSKAINELKENPNNPKIDNSAIKSWTDIISEAKESNYISPTLYS